MQPAAKYPILCAALAYYAAAHIPQQNPAPAVVLHNAQSGAGAGLGLPTLTGTQLLAAENWLALPGNFCDFVRHCGPADSDYWGGLHKAYAETITVCLAVANLS